MKTYDDVVETSLRWYRQRLVNRKKACELGLKAMNRDRANARPDELYSDDPFERMKLMDEVLRCAICLAYLDRQEKKPRNSLTKRHPSRKHE